MAKYPPLLPANAQHIVEHNLALIAACDSAISKLRATKVGVDRSWVAANLEYWKHARQALVWSNEIAYQRSKRFQDATRKSI